MKDRAVQFVCRQPSKHTWAARETGECCRTRHLVDSKGNVRSSSFKTSKVLVSYLIATGGALSHDDGRSSYSVPGIIPAVTYARLITSSFLVLQVIMTSSLKNNDQCPERQAFLIPWLPLQHFLCNSQKHSRNNF